MLEAIAVVLVGLGVGSFLNVVIYRTKSGQSIVFGRSKCQKCQTVIAAYDLVPVVSFFVLKGKCRQCSALLSVQYVLIEFVTAGLFLFIYWRYVIGLALPEFYLDQFFWVFVLRDFVLVSFLIIIFVYDWLYQLIPDRFTLPVIVISGLVNLYLGLAWWSILLGGLVVGGFFLGQFMVSKGKWIGGGDIRMGLLIGVILGLSEGLLALFLAYALGAIISLILIITKKAKWQSMIPFGTFLTLSTILMLILGPLLSNWYFGLFL
ncbi:prepilin peptidase [Patescibacteria group bacterium]